MFLPILLSVATLSYLLYLYFSRTLNYWKKRNVVGPKPLPFFGNLLESTLRKKTVGLVLEDIYKQFSKEKVVGVFRMTTPALMINDVDLIKLVMVKDFDCFTDRGVEFSKKGLGINLFHADGDSWSMLRSRFTPIFTSGKLKNMLYLMVEKSHLFLQYVDKMYQENSEQNIYQFIQNYTISTISACAFGMDLDMMKDDFTIFKEIDKKIFTPTHFIELDMMYPGILSKINGSLFPKELARYFDGIVKNVSKARNGKPSSRKDLMDSILELRAAGELHGSNKLSKDETALEITDGVIAAQAFVFYFAGYETSASTMTFMMYLLAKHPEVQDKLIAEIDQVLEKYNGEITYDGLFEMKYLEMVFNETLRVYPIVESLQRNAKVDYKLPGTGVEVKKDQTVLVSVLGIHNDDRYFKDPHKFYPERFAPENAGDMNPAAYMPFGTGPRNCIGMRFAKVQSWVCISRLLSKYRVEPCPKTRMNMVYNPYRIVLAPLGGMPLKLVLRSKS